MLGGHHGQEQKATDFYNFRMAAVLVPLLDEPAIASPPLGKLPCHADIIKNIWHIRNGNFIGFQGMLGYCINKCINLLIHIFRNQEGSVLSNGGGQVHLQPGEGMQSGPEQPSVPHVPHGLCED